MICGSRNTSTMDLNSIAPAKGFIRVNHEGCPAGEDTKNRLFIRRQSDGSVFAYCHHCGNRYSQQGGRFRNRHTLRAPESHSNGEITLPLGFTSSFNDWPVEARSWPLRYGVKPEEIPRWGFDVWSERVVIPVYDPDLKGYQTRRIYDDDPRPKYLTKGKNLIYKLDHNKSDTLVLTEDALSATKCARVCNAWAVLGTTVAPEKLIQAARYPRIYIWLDNDNADVKLKQRDLKRKIELFGGKPEIIKTNKDPKCYTTIEIQEMMG